MIRYVIPGFRIPEAAIDKDISFIEKMGVEIRTNTEITSVADIKAEGYDAVILATGANKPGTLKLEKGETVNALKFLADFKANDGKVDLGKNVVVIGGGNTAMDTARAAKRTEGVEHVYLVYRRTKRYMPAAEDELLEVVVVIGGGNTAMDTARAAKRTEGVEHVYLVYRRTKRYMPAAEDELLEVLEEGVEFKELLSPVSLENGTLICKKMELGAVDASGRAGVTETDEIVEVPADTVIVAVGEKVPTEFYEANGINVNERGKAKLNQETLETSVKDVYLAGDGAKGAATIVEAIRDVQIVAKAILGTSVVSDRAVTGTDAECYEKKGILKEEKEAEKESQRCLSQIVAKAILGTSVVSDRAVTGTDAECYEKKGILKEEKEAEKESQRCLSCSKVCENCVDVCPNRANISIKVPGMEMAQVIHVDYMCNECGNCKTFCPYASAPYKDKFTLFAKAEDMDDSTNDGFAVLNAETKECRVRFLGNTTDCKADDPADTVPAGIRDLILAVINDYSYLLYK